MQPQVLLVRIVPPADTLCARARTRGRSVLVAFRLARTSRGQANTERDVHTTCACVYILIGLPLKCIRLTAALRDFP